MIETVKRYIENRIQLFKLEMVTVSANVASGLVSSFLILIFMLFIFLMLSFSLAFWLSSIFESNEIGFGLVGGIYVIIFAFYIGFGRKIVENKVKDIIVSSALSSDDEIEQSQEQ